LLDNLSSSFIARQNLTNNKITNSSDAERYFAVETARGYIVINREYEYIYSFSCLFLFYDISFLFSFKDQIEGARLLSLLAQINSWPAAIFTDLKYEKKFFFFLF
jgi:hypothetical protein